MDCLFDSLQLHNVCEGRETVANIVLTVMHNSSITHLMHAYVLMLTWAVTHKNRVDGVHRKRPVLMESLFDSAREEFISTDPPYLCIPMMTANTPQTLRKHMPVVPRIRALNCSNINTVISN